MGDGEQRGIQHQVVVEEDVNVDQSRAVTEGLLPSQRRLQPFEVLEQRVQPRDRLSPSPPG
ncbi:MAG: hypothetical protein MZV64_00400 [Ignavibacteriales bacterium]|nr:hypothetical protein [Ignavibacteriales bacterium]